MITNKDIRVENGNLVLNGDKYPLDGQSPEAIMQIVEDNSDSTPTENSTKPVKSGGIYIALDTINDTIGDITQTGLTGDSVAAQLGNASEQIAEKSGVIALNSGWNFDPSSSNTIRRVGDIAWISSYIYNSNDLTANTTYEIGTIPTGFIPSKSYKFPTYEGAGGSGLRGVVEIKSDGKLMYRSLDGNRYAIFTTIIYPLS